VTTPKEIEFSKEYSWSDVMNAKTRDELNEASLGRVYQHVKKENIDSWAIIASYRDENKGPKNTKNFKRLQQQIRSADLGFFKLMAHGKKENDDGNVVHTKELSLFIPGIDLQLAENLMNQYGQWGIIYSGPESDGEVLVVEKNGTMTAMGRFHPQKIAEVYSRVKGRTVVFELKASTINAARTLEFSGREIPGID
jgi:hypothetical protein